MYTITQSTAEGMVAGALKQSGTLCVQQLQEMELLEPSLAPHSLQ
jgi:hypothetical protein